LPLSSELREVLSKRRRPDSHGRDAAIGQFRRDEAVGNIDRPIHGIGQGNQFEKSCTATSGGPADDPNDVIDPDDLTGTEPIRCAFLLPPPAQSEAWWTAIVLGRENGAVSSQDTLLALTHVAYRLGYARAVMGNPHHGLVTVGQLHATLEELYGVPGWTALVECWHTAAGIVQPERRTIRSDTDILNRIPDRTNPAAVSAQSTSFKSAAFDTEQPPLPPTPYDLDPGLAHAISTAPRKVAAFLLHGPRDPPAWRQKESESERSQREQLERLGGWPGA
jgi:hypothetical protein